MKVTGRHTDSMQKPKLPRRRSSHGVHSGAGVRLRDGAQAPNRRRPVTPLIPRKFGAGAPAPEIGREVASARELGGFIWRLQFPEAEEDRLEPIFQFPNCAMEGTTKWNLICLKPTDKVQKLYGDYDHSNHHYKPVHANPKVSTAELELERAHNRIHVLEADKRSAKKKLEHFLKKLSEERADWRNREHEKIRAIIEEAKADLKHERRSRQRLEIVNSKLVNELADAKSLEKRCKQDYVKERKTRELIEEVCDELAKEIAEDKAEVEALKRECMRMRGEVEKERKMLQMAEVWREERVQMKLIDAKVMIEEKYTYMNKLVADLEAFVGARSSTAGAEEMREAEFFQEAAASVNVQGIKEFVYEPPNQDDIFAVFDDVNFGNTIERDIESCAHLRDKDINQSCENEEDENGCVTVSHVEDHSSNCSPEGSDPSVNKNYQKSNGPISEIKWGENEREGSSISDISEVCSPPKAQLKKALSIVRLWRSGPTNGKNFKMISVDEINGRFSGGRLSNGAITSPDHGSGKSKHSPPDLSCQWSPSELGNPHIPRGMKGCIEWPRGTQKSCLKPRSFDARTDSRKIQLKQILKHKI